MQRPEGKSSDEGNGTADTVPLAAAKMAGSQTAPSGASDVSAASAASAASKKYEVAAEIGRGGMGMILRVIDRDVKREVAMKVMLSTADKNTTLRFMEEGHITGQLEHPNIVPVHDVGVDSNGRPYFTMKLVKGRSLAEILNDSQSIPTVPQLLRIFVSACHAVSFAHSRGVLHRDLKPANIMTGDFGEVLVMDWGLAKDLKSERLADSPNILGGGLTKAGMALGTPAYMPPEQARGDLSHIDPRSDIYSLGAILYEILTLKPPVEGSDVVSLMGNVIEGKIVTPELRTPSRKIPRELSAIAMKALALDPMKRYQSAENLIADIQLFLEGRAVSAKEDSAMETAVKLFNRHRTESIVSIVAFVALCTAIGVGFWVNNAARVRAERAQKTAEEERAKAEKALASLEEEQNRGRKDKIAAAPAFMGRAENAVAARDFDSALQDVEVALTYNPDLASARMLKAQILASRKNYGGAVQELDAYVLLKADDADAQQLRSLCQQAQGRETLEIINGILDVFVRQQAYVFAEDPRQSADKLFEIYRHQIDKAWPGLGRGLQRENDGQITLDLGKNKVVCDLKPLRNMPIKKLWVHETNIKDIGPISSIPLTNLSLAGTAVRSLEPLNGMKLEVLNLDRCREISDLSPLEGMPLTWISMHGCFKLHDISPLAGMPFTLITTSFTPVRDISALAGMKLKKFHARNSPLNDISALKDMPLETLNLNHTPVFDLSPLQGCPIKELWIRNCNVSDLSPLKDSPLEDIDILNTRITDLTPLQGKKLKFLYFTPKNIVKGLEIVRSMESLSEIGANVDRRLPAAEFWKKYDEGVYRK